MFALLITALAVAGLLRRSIDRSTDELLVARVEAVAAQAAGGDLDATLGSTGREIGQVQVVTADGEIIARTSGLAETSRFDVVPAPPLDSDEPSSATVDGTTIDDDPSEQYRVVSVSVATPDGPVSVYAVTSLDISADAQAYLQSRLLVVLPLLTLVTGLVVFGVVARSLRPVDELRRQVDSLSPDDLAARVEAPESDLELARLGDTLNGMLDRIERSAERQRRFAADASHELRSPLSAMRTDLEVGLAYPDRTDWQRTAHDALAEIERLERLSRDLRLLTASSASVDADRCDLVDVVSHEVERRDVSPLRLDVRLPAPTAIATVGLGENAAVQVIRNLLDNAERHAESWILVGLAVIDADGHDGGDDDEEAVADAQRVVELVVGNDGPTIDPDDRERVFEAFTRLDEARSLDAGGSGLGLAITRSLVTEGGGTIRIDPTSPTTRFVVRLPLHAPTP